MMVYAKVLTAPKSKGLKISVIRYMVNATLSIVYPQISMVLFT